MSAFFFKVIVIIILILSWKIPWWPPFHLHLWTYQDVQYIIRIPDSCSFAKWSAIFDLIYGLGETGRQMGEKWKFGGTSNFFRPWSLRLQEFQESMTTLQNYNYSAFDWYAARLGRQRDVGGVVWTSHLSQPDFPPSPVSSWSILFLCLWLLI